MFDSFINGKYGSIKVPVKVDKNGYIQVTSHAHALIHQGDLFTYSIETLVGGSGTVLDHLIITPAEELTHLTYGVNTLNSASVYLYYNPSYSNIGTPQALHNRKHNSSKTSDVAIYSAPTITSAGSIKQSALIAFGIDASPQFNDWLLKSSATYLFRYISRGGNNRGSIRFDIHPHRDGLGDYD